MDNNIPNWGHGCMERDGCRCGYIFDGGESAIAKVFYNDPLIIENYDKKQEIITIEQAHANMCMISASYEMYEALKELLNDKGIDQVNALTCNKARKALAKAEEKSE